MKALTGLIKPLKSLQKACKKGPGSQKEGQEDQGMPVERPLKALEDTEGQEDQGMSVGTPLKTFEGLNRPLKTS